MNDEDKNTGYLETEKECAMPGIQTQAQTQAERDHDLLMRIDENVQMLLARRYVTQSEFAPVKAIVYGTVGLIGISVVGGILALVINHA